MTKGEGQRRSVGVTLLTSCRKYFEWLEKELAITQVQQTHQPTNSTRTTTTAKQQNNPTTTQQVNHKKTEKKTPFRTNLISTLAIRLVQRKLEQRT